MVARAGGRISPPPPPLRSPMSGRQGLPSAIPSSQKVEGGFVEGAKKRLELAANASC